MMTLRSGNTIIVGITQDCLDKLALGRGLYIDGDRLNMPGKHVYLIVGENDAALAIELRAAGLASVGSTGIPQPGLQ